MNDEIKKVLLHVCCGVCATSVVEQLREEGFSPVGFFYNPNIHPREEYVTRKKEFQRFADTIGLPVVEDPYRPREWFAVAQQYAQEPEGGKRCMVCIRLRLQEAARLSREKHFDYFATTLTVSPHKNSETVNTLGTDIDMKKFLVRDFKKRDGFLKAIRFAKHYRLYRQHYCGCVYSKMSSSRERTVRV